MAAQLLSVLVISAAIFMGGIYAMNSLGADQEFKKLGSALEIYRLKKQNPLATGEDLKKAAIRGKQESLVDLIQSSKSGKRAEEELAKGLENISGERAGAAELGVTASESQEQFQQSQQQAQRETSPQQQQTQVIEFDGRHGVDPLAVDQINALNVPENVRQEILKNYERTGVLPTLRKPSSN